MVSGTVHCQDAGSRGIPALVTEQSFLRAARRGSDVRVTVAVQVTAGSGDRAADGRCLPSHGGRGIPTRVRWRAVGD